MKVVLIASSANKHDLAWRDVIKTKIEAIGAEVLFLQPGQLWQEADVLAVLFDGHDLSVVEAARIGAFRLWADQVERLPKPLIVGYNYSGGSDAALKDFTLFNHIANTERNFIYCLKDYIFIQNKHHA
jgi:hypothetical protein